MRPERRRAIAILLATACAIAALEARAVTYASVAEPFAWIDSASHADVVWTGAPGGPAAACTGGTSPTDDDVSDLLPLGFTFEFGGVAYTQVRIMSNGRVQFANTHCNFGTASVGPPPTYPDPYPSANLLRTIRVYGADLEPSLGGSVRWASIGSAPNRLFVVTWFDVREWNQPASRFRLQIVLNEDGSFVLRYGASTNSSGGKADIGWEVDTTDYEKRTYTNLGSLSNTAQRYFIPGPIAEYRFDESVWNGTAGEILDAAGGDQAGAALGAASSTASGYVCRGGLFAANSTAAAISAATTPLALPSDGTITFWVRIDAAWNGGSSAVLLDASNDLGATSADRAFQLHKDGSGRLVFLMTNASGTVISTSSGTSTIGTGVWQHVAITWSLANGRINVFRGGSVVAARTGAAIPAPVLAPLWVGDAHDGVGTSGLAVASANGAIDEVRVYAYEGTRALVLRDMSATRPCPSVTGFRVSHDRNGIHCLAEPVTVTARASDGTTVTSYAGAIVLDTQSGRGNWSAHAGDAGTFSDAVADDGRAAYVFAPADLGVARFWLTYRAGSTPIDVDVQESGAPGVRDDDAEGTLAFGPSGFVVTASPVSNPPPGTIDTAVPARTAGTANALYLTAYGQTATDPECGVIETYSGAKALSTWASGLDPASLAAAPLVNGTAVGTSSASATSLPVAFTSGQASVSVRHDDVGRIRLSFLDPSAAEPAGGIPGASDAFVVRPADFAVTSITRADGSANPGATTPAGSVFVASGTPFVVTVEARNALGGRTPSYGRESTPEGVSVQSSLLAPAGGRNGSAGTGALAGGSAFSAITPAGTFRGAAVAFDEVGAISLRARVADGSYLGAGDVVGTASGAVGRFTPARFAAAVDPVAFETGCRAGRFTYLGAPLAFAPGLHPVIRVEAQSASGTTTQNYTGAWFRLTPDTIAPRAWSAEHGTLDSAGPNAPSVADLGGGRGRLELDQGPTPAFVRDAPEAAFAAEIGIALSILDADGVAYAANPLRIGQPAAGLGIAFQDGNEMRWGRLAFQNAYGPELRALDVPLRAEHFDGLRFVPNADDVCTSVPAARVALARTPGGLATAAAVAHDPFVAGEAGLSLSAPGAGNTGSVVLGADLSAKGADLPHLRFDWSGDGVHDDDPLGLATFGIWEGDDAVVYVRERY